VSIRRVFHFRPVPFIATLLLVALGCSLSLWQTRRAHQKEAIEARLQAHENAVAIPLPAVPDFNQLEYARVVLSGEFDPRWPVYLDNRPMNGMAGIVVLMPFRLQNQNKYVLVARGWVPRNSLDRFSVKPYQTPSGIIQIEGMIKANAGHVYQFGASAPLQPGVLVQNLELSEFEQASRLQLVPFIVEQSKGSEDGLLRDWPRASMGSERHRGYAFQWMGLAVMALLFFLVTSFGKSNGIDKDGKRTDE